MPKAGAIQRIFHVELKVYIEGFEDHTYFGSKKAIFDHFGDKNLGITLVSFRTLSNRPNGMPFENARCIIREGIMRTANRTGNSEASKKLYEIFGNK